MQQQPDSEAREGEKYPGKERFQRELDQGKRRSCQKNDCPIKLV